ncbi:hypothetical protein L2719_07670 [Shewanella schlegeliana]|uniref:Uncharacterized protein n=1 Tax=Shewanella schlegeliana TaxID=190308 RepID=A0ABS1T3F5_9GAMM|nr:hypothetical protein [Shewanella schlegeliana]MBL4914357.1 hypothetical protein [Shewanella schlegeliana]MCL1109420.1 hypothetical protein [Shewanella schlegeliana]GIU32010.1 hypothetical protein TUM4433_24440 [Shewanella schlegeliana]
MKKHNCPSGTPLSASLLLLTLSYSSLSFAAVDAANIEFVTAKQLEDSIQLDKAYDKYQEIAEQYSPSTIAKLSKIRLNELNSQVFRNGVKVDNDKYPQVSKLALAKSVAKALSSHDYPYFFAHLGMPEDGTVFYAGLDQEEYNGLVKQVSELKPAVRERLINDYSAIAASLQNEIDKTIAGAIANAKQSKFSLSINGCRIADSINTCYNYRSEQGNRYIILEQAGRFYFSGL